jgi:hypothetical protein
LADGRTIRVLPVRPQNLVKPLTQPNALLRGEATGSPTWLAPEEHRVFQPRRSNCLHASGFRCVMGKHMS